MSRKQGSHFNKRFQSRFVGEHDDRGEQFIRRVTHHNNHQGPQGRISKRDKKLARVKDRLGGWDDDIEVLDDLGQGGSGGSHYGSRGGGPGRFRFQANQLKTAMKRSHWYEVTITNGSRYSRAEILASIEKVLDPQKYYPICYQIIRTDSTFFVETFQMAQLVLSYTRKIHMPDGQPLVFRIRAQRPPNLPIDSIVTARIKEIMAQRYSAELNALDLSRFYRDPGFIDGMFCALSRGPVLAAVIKIINENIPNLSALNLTGNAIYDLSTASEEFKALKQLKVLHMAENQISNLNTLNCFKGSVVSEVLIEKNPVSQNFPDRNHFVRYAHDSAVTEIRRRFPKLTKLDNVDLAPVVTFDVGDDSVLPTPQAASICVPEGRDFVKAFLSQYFLIYDSDNRVELTQAYTADAVFSLIAHYPPHVPDAPPGPRLNSYFGESRNLLRLQDFPRRKNKLKQGREEVVDFLFKQLPKTQHDLPSFAVDLVFFMPELIQLAVSGIFRETGVGSQSNWPLRYFCRNFLIVPSGGGFCITNDMLFVSNCTEEQKAVAFKVEPEKPVAAVVSPSPVVPSPHAVASPAAVGSPVIDDSVKMQMVQTVALQTGMNMDWSRKCLEETDWDFQRAAYTFNELQKRGSIPAEAFIK